MSGPEPSVGADDLVKRLRILADQCSWTGLVRQPALEAADTIARLERERDGWKRNCQVQLEEAHRNISENARLEAENARLREALKPFADYLVDQIKAGHQTILAADTKITLGSAMARRQLTMGDCYNARAALQAPGDAT